MEIREVSSPADKADSKPTITKVEVQPYVDFAEVLKSLDVKNDDHWTGDGQPSLVYVTSLVGRGVTREEITKAAPDFNRTVLIKAELDKAAAAEKKIAQERLEAQKKLDEVIEVQEAKELSASERFAIDNRRYLDLQTKLRTERAEQARILPPNPKSPIDQVFQKKGFAGSKRP